MTSDKNFIKSLTEVKTDPEDWTLQRERRPGKECQETKLSTDWWCCTVKGWCSFL